MSIISNPAFFNDVNLETIQGLTVLRTNPYAPGRRNVVMSQLVHSDRAKVNSANYDRRTITVGVGITRSTRALVEQSLDDLMALLQPIDKALVFPQSGKLRKYYATFVGEPDIVQQGGSYLELDLAFECSDKLGYDTAATLLLQITGYTSNYKSDLLNFIGSALWQSPVITLTFTALSGGTGATVSIGNAATGQELNIQRTWAAGDVLIVDPLGNGGVGSVTVNGVEVDFTGAIPKWKKGLGYWYYRDTLTTRTITGQINQYGIYV